MREGGREGGRREEGGARPLRIAPRHNTLQLAFTTPLSFPPLHSASERWTNLLGGHFLESTLSHILQRGSDCGYAQTTWLQEKLITHNTWLPEKLITHNTNNTEMET